MTGSDAPEGRRIRSLDNLRGIAILMVLASHYVPAVTPAWRDGAALAAFGRGGVILFFLLSGYLIFRNLQRQPVPVFLLRRLFKILPSYWLNLGCILALGWTLPGAGQHSAVVYLTNFLMISDATHDPAVSGVYWTLLIEVKFYLFIAIQYALLRDRFLIAVIGGLIALNLAAFALRGHGDMLLAFFPAFYVGVYAYRAEQRNWRGREMYTLALTVLASAANMLAALPDYPVWSAAYVVVGAALFVLVVRWRFGYGWLGFLGATSYNNYLYHSMIGGLVIALLGSTPFAAIAALAAATGVAVVLYRTVEQPLVSFGRHREKALLGRSRLGLVRPVRDPSA